MPSAPLPPLTLVTGDEELLVSRAVTQVVAAARRADPEADIRDLAPGDVDLADLLDLLSPSLFGSLRVVVLRDVPDLAREVADAVARYAADPLDEVVLVVCHPGGAKGKALLEAMRAAGAREVTCPKVRRPRERLAVLHDEVRRAGRRSTDEALHALVEAVGVDLRDLTSALSQLLEDTEGPLGEETVALYYRGRADASGFTIADRAVEGDAAGALERLRSGLANGLAPVLVSSAVAGSLRAIALVAAAQRPDTGELARRLGMPPWKVDLVRRQSRGWQPEGLRQAAAAAARLDADVKGGAADPVYALERALLAVVAARSAP